MKKLSHLKHFYQNSQLDKREIDLILCHVLEISTAQLMIYDKEITQDQKKQIDTFLKQRQAGKPYAYIVGRQAFWTLDLIVNKHTLIPRPETELIVELVLSMTDKEYKGKILDLGTGTGAIALSIASERKKAKITAIDFSQKCIQTALENREKYNISNVSIEQSNWFDRLSKENTFNFIVSNPPYIDEDDEHLKELSYEPLSALTAKKKGYSDIYKIIEHAKDYMEDNAWIILEHGYNQHKKIQSFLHDNCYKNIKTVKDLAEIPRITIAQWQNLAIIKQ